ncbi:MAG TPA: alpha-L-arabinofuranosidase C-terminal domain-containing protein [Humibacter sp.]|nr:alpha-L-arabinofuranosidase C-terminal domain-containing protein [Humibacter sp.]
MSTPAAVRRVSEVRAVVDLDEPGAVISRHVYGQFAEHLGHGIYGGFWVGPDSDIPNIRGIRTDIVEALREIRVPNVRWPGGCFADEYHWRDGTGRPGSRARMVNTHWGDVVEDNSFGTHEFMLLCELLQAEPYISANVGSGTVREASEWVEYLTRGDDSPMSALRRQNGRDEPWKVRFWGLGNEPWGCGGRMDAEAYAATARTFGTYSRDHGGNKLYRIAAGANSDAYEWTETLMRTLGFRLGHSRPEGEGVGAYQAISFHSYTVPGTAEAKGSATCFETDEYYRTLARATQVGEQLQRHAAIMDAYDPDRTIGLALDEWGVWLDAEPDTHPGFLYQQNSVRDALVASIHLDEFHRHADRLVMANIAQTVNVLQAVLLTDGPTLIRTPTYWVFEMSKGHQDAHSLRVRLDNVRRVESDGRSLPLASASASRTEGSALISLSNLDADEPALITVELRGGVAGAARGRMLTADRATAHNTSANPDLVTPVELSVQQRGSDLVVELPPHTFATIELEVG